MHNQFIILPSAYDEQVFSNNNLDKKNKRLVYAGTLFRFGESRFRIAIQRSSEFKRSRSSNCDCFK